MELNLFKLAFLSLLFTLFLQINAQDEPIQEAHLQENVLVVDIIDLQSHSPFLCSGTVLAPRFVLATASCLTVRPFNRIYVRRNAEQVIIHPDYTIGQNNLNNIGIVRISGLFNDAEPSRILGGLPTNSSCNLVGWGGAERFPRSEPVNIYGPQYCNSSNPQVFCSTSTNFAVCNARLASVIICGIEDTVNGLLISESGCESNDNRLYYHSISDHAGWINQVLSSSVKQVESLVLILSMMLITLNLKL
ncbi:CLUMA_CG017887, isoform A [Clunio marinus]|uniref:CLUMA_CG017887, isoform A n=1 Tax=Clunio marinus TaxID=568069 RepID=A0A1J1IYR9_9DIPT|nr:CLUMA_CG017887, isoform A [Clunio marinus]